MRALGSRWWLPGRGRHCVPRAAHLVLAAFLAFSNAALSTSDSFVLLVSASGALNDASVRHLLLFFLLDFDFLLRA